MAAALEVGGTCDPRFAEVKRAFARNFEAGLEIGACFAATARWRIRGRPLGRTCRPGPPATLGAGNDRQCLFDDEAHDRSLRADARRSRPARPRRPRRPLLARVRTGGGKDTLPVRYLLSHTSGLAGFAEPIPAEALYDWDLTSCACWQRRRRCGSREPRADTTLSPSAICSASW